MLSCMVNYTQIQCVGETMSASYNKLWKLLIDKNMKKQQLAEIAGVSISTIGRLGRDEAVNTSVLIKICEALDCDIGDIMEIRKET